MICFHISQRPLLSKRDTGRLPASSNAILSLGRTAANIAKFRNDPNAPFWKNLKEGSDYFEALREELGGTYGASVGSSLSREPRAEYLADGIQQYEGKKAATLGSGFLYAISRLGVTGARDQVHRREPLHSGGCRSARFARINPPGQ